MVSRSRRRGEPLTLSSLLDRSLQLNHAHNARQSFLSPLTDDQAGALGKSIQSRVERMERGVADGNAGLHNGNLRLAVRHRSRWRRKQAKPAEHVTAPQIASQV